MGNLLSVWVWMTMNKALGPPESLPPTEAIKHLRAKNVCPDLDERVMAELKRRKRTRFQPITQFDAEELAKERPGDAEVIAELIMDQAAMLVRRAQACLYDETAKKRFLAKPIDAAMDRAQQNQFLADVVGDYTARLEQDDDNKWVAYGLALALVALDSPAREMETIAALKKAIALLRPAGYKIANPYDTPVMQGARSLASASVQPVVGVRVHIHLGELLVQTEADPHVVCKLGKGGHADSERRTKAVAVKRGEGEGEGEGVSAAAAWDEPLELSLGGPDCASYQTMEATGTVVLELRVYGKRPSGSATTAGEDSAVDGGSDGGGGGGGGGGGEVLGTLRLTIGPKDSSSRRFYELCDTEFQKVTQG